MPARADSFGRVDTLGVAKRTTRSGAIFGRVSKPRAVRPCEKLVKAPKATQNVRVSSSPCSNGDAAEAHVAPKNLESKPQTASSCAAAYLSLAFSPSGPPLARQQEFETMRQLLSDATRSEARAIGVYVCGTPGTGKTLTVSKVLDHLQASPSSALRPQRPMRSPSPSPSSASDTNLSSDTDDDADRTQAKLATLQGPVTVWINCAHLQTPRALYPEIASALHLDNATSATADDIRAFATSHGARVVVVLDEVDFLVSRDQHVLYTAFEWPHLEASRLTLVGIANAIDLPVRLLPWLRANACMPDIVPFAPYNAAALTGIVKQRIEETEVEMALSGVAISLAAKKVAAGSGDARLVLDVCREAEARVRRDGGEARESIAVVSSVLSERGGLSAAVETVRQLPVQQQLALCVAANAVLMGGSSASGAGKGLNRKATLGGLYDSFVRMCSRARVSCVPFPEFADICCNALVHHGLLDVPPVRGRKGGGAGKTLRSKAVRLRVPIEDVRVGVANQGFLPMLITR